jgi:glycine/D-amino acid oxidase-like deaminating enzyme
VISAPHIVVVGAGAFGGWTALSLLRRGARVTLIDAWGAGHSRSSSGDETRLIRAMYNGDAVYTDMVHRALTLWREAEAAWGRRVFDRTGVIYLFENDDGFATKSLPIMRKRGIDVERLTRAESAKRFPQIAFDGVRVAYFEPDAGVLLARASCELVRETFERSGGVYRQSYIRPGRIKSGRLAGLMLDDGTALPADAFVFACGPWMGKVFPEVIGGGIVATRQDVIYFGTPAGDHRFDRSACPGWINFGARRYYGMPGNERRGFKVADDTVGAAVDPTSLDRMVSPAAIRGARALVRRRFPALADQPIVETRVCQYEYSPDANFLLDRHPEVNNAWLVGGGSGHGFKMGPALGEYVSRLVLDSAVPDEQFTYPHFAAGRARVKGSKRRKLHS